MPLKFSPAFPNSSPSEGPQKQSKVLVMTLRTILRLALAVAAIAVVLALYLEWRAARRERQQLAEQLAAAEKTLADAQERQKARDAELHDTLAQLAEQKRRTKSPEDIVRALTRELALPKPITLVPTGSVENPESAGQGTAEKGSAAQGSPETSQGGVPSSESAPAPIQSGPAQIPAEDLKPLFDFVIDCKACQAQLSAAQGDLTDERAKNAALVTERDAAIKAAKGGGFWRRVRRAAKWFAIGAAAGAVAAAAH